MAGQQTLSAADLQALQEMYEASQKKQSALAAIALDKDGFVRNIVTGIRAEALRRHAAERGLAIIESALLAADAEKIYEASLASSYEEVVNVVYGARPGSTTNVFGSTNLDLVYTPINPCRALDSRSATGSYLGTSFAGPYAADSAHSFAVTDPINFYGSQGGSATCGIPIGVARAVVLNITVASPSTYGDLRIYPFNTTAPNASILNFNPYQNVANAVVAPICLGCNQDLVVLTDYASTHVIVDVLGYFAAPEATPLQSTVVSNPTTAPAGGYSLDSPACPAGYTLIGGGYSDTSSATGNWVWGSFPLGSPATAWRVRGNNTSGGTINITIYATCARVPGR